MTYSHSYGLLPRWTLGISCAASMLINFCFLVWLLGPFDPSTLNQSRSVRLVKTPPFENMNSVCHVTNNSPIKSQLITSLEGKEFKPVSMHLLNDSNFFTKRVKIKRSFEREAGGQVNRYFSRFTQAEFEDFSSSDSNYMDISASISTESSRGTKKKSKGKQKMKSLREIDPTYEPEMKLGSSKKKSNTKLKKSNTKLKKSNTKLKLSRSGSRTAKKRKDPVEVNLDDIPITSTEIEVIPINLITGYLHKKSKWLAASMMYPSTQIRHRSVYIALELMGNDILERLGVNLQKYYIDVNQNGQLEEDSFNLKTSRDRTQLHSIRSLVTYVELSNNIFEPPLFSEGQLQKAQMDIYEEAKEFWKIHEKSKDDPNVFKSPQHNTFVFQEVKKKLHHIMSDTEYRFSTITRVGSTLFLHWLRVYFPTLHASLSSSDDNLEWCPWSLSLFNDVLLSYNWNDRIQAEIRSNPNRIRYLKDHFLTFKIIRPFKVALI